jgi:hypothetical protein
MKNFVLAAVPAFVLALGGIAPGAHAAVSPAQKPAATMGTDGAHDATARRMTKALNLLEAKGYGDFKNFHVDGRDFVATVTQGGEPSTVIIDPDVPSVTQQG